MTTTTYADWLAGLEGMERAQRERYLAGRDGEGDSLGKQIEQWIIAGRAQGHFLRDGRPLTEPQRPVLPPSERKNRSVDHALEELPGATPALDKAANGGLASLKVF